MAISDQDATDARQAAIEASQRRAREGAVELFGDLCCVEVTVPDAPCEDCTEALLYLRSYHRRLKRLRDRSWRHQMTIQRLRRRLARYELADGALERVRRTARFRAQEVGLPAGPSTETDVLENLMVAVEERHPGAQALATSRLLLLHLMRQISEEAYCAGWLTGLQEALYRCVEEQSTDFGMGFSEDTLALLTATQAMAGGWWVMDLDAGIREPMFFEEWTPDE